MNEADLLESPTRDVGLPAAIAAINLVLEAQGAIRVCKVEARASVQVLNEHVEPLCAGGLDADGLGLAGVKVTLECSGDTVVASTSPLRVIIGKVLVLEDITAGEATGGNGGHKGRENSGDLHIGVWQLKELMKTWVRVGV